MDPSPKATKKELVTAFRTREILAAARRVMHRHGLEAFTMEEIASDAGVAKGTIYLYFQGKEELIQALMSQVGENLLLDLKALIDSPGSPEEKLPKAVTILLGYLDRERFLFPIYARDAWRGNPPVKKSRWRTIQELEENYVALLTRLFAQGMEAGRFIPADPRLLTFLLRGLVRAVGYYQMAEDREDAAKEALPVLLYLLSTGLTRPPASPAEGART